MRGIMPRSGGKIEGSRSSPTWPTLVAIADGLGVSLLQLAEAIEAESEAGEGQSDGNG
jgi:hypothetical protein